MKPELSYIKLQMRIFFPVENIPEEMTQNKKGNPIGLPFKL